MTYLLTAPTIEVYLSDPTGTRIAMLDYLTAYEYALAVNEPSPFKVVLPSIFDRSLVTGKVDQIIEIWRGIEPGTLKLDYMGFIRSKLFSDDIGNVRTELYGVSIMDLLRRRIVQDPKDSAKSKMTDYSDDMCKQIVADQLGATAGAGRDLTSVGGGFTVAAKKSLGVSITKEFEYQRVLKVLQDIAKTSEQLGKRLYFDIVPVDYNISGAIAFQFRTYIGQRGNDHSWNSGAPINIGNDWGNFQSGNVLYENSEDINYVYVLGAGEGVSREVVPVSDPNSTVYSIWNRCEGSVDCKDATPGASAAMQAEGYAYIKENKGIIKLTGDLIETPACRYGRDFGHGDLLTVNYGGMQADCLANTVLVSKAANEEEIISVKLEWAA